MAETITLTRRQTAREECELAIHLLYTGGSLISANLLAWASMEVTAGVAKTLGIETMVELMTGYVRDDKRKEWFTVLKSHYNFAKHADKDPMATVDINSDIVEFVIFEALMDYRSVYKQLTYPMLLHGTYMFAKMPDIATETGLDIAGVGSALLGENPDIEKIAQYYDGFLRYKADVYAGIADKDKHTIEWP